MPKTPSSAAPAAVASGGFRRDGSWNPQAAGLDSLTGLVWELCRMRRRGASPRMVAEAIVASEHASVFGPQVIEDWGSCASAALWFARFSPNQVSACVRIGGRGYYGWWFKQDPTPTWEEAFAEVERRDGSVAEAIRLLKTLSALEVPCEIVERVEAAEVPAATGWVPS
jgi:hypothetical protein